MNAEESKFQLTENSAEKLKKKSRLTACDFSKYGESEELEPLGVVTLFHSEATHMFIVSATTPTYTGTRQTTHHYN